MVRLSSMYRVTFCRNTCVFVHHLSRVSPTSGPDEHVSAETTEFMNKIGVYKYRGVFISRAKQNGEQVRGCHEIKSFKG